jgi:hypothetical protein
MSTMTAVRAFSRQTSRLLMLECNGKRERSHHKAPITAVTRDWVAVSMYEVLACGS